MEKIKILIVDDHPAMRHGLAQLIGMEPDMEVVAEAGDCPETLAAIREKIPDFVILDIALKGVSGLDLIFDIHQLAGPIPILVYSMHDETLYAERALHAGARGYLMKQEPVRQILTAIRRILKEGIYVSEEMNRVLLLRHIGHPSEKPDYSSSTGQLTERERQVFQLVGKGLQPREIAEKLNLSVKTVETHRMNIRKKLGLPDASALALYAVEWVHKKH